MASKSFRLVSPKQAKENLFRQTLYIFNADLNIECNPLTINRSGFSPFAVIVYKRVFYVPYVTRFKAICKDIGNQQTFTVSNVLYFHNIANLKRITITSTNFKYFLNFNMVIAVIFY